MILDVLKYLIGVNKIECLVTKWNPIVFSSRYDSQKVIFLTNFNIYTERVKTQLSKLVNRFPVAAAEIQDCRLWSNTVAKVMEYLCVQLDIGRLLGVIRRSIHKHCWR